MQNQISTATIPRANVLEACLELGSSTTRQIGTYLQRPAGYDMGSRLASMCNQGFLTKVKGDDEANEWIITEKGKKYLAANKNELQPIGHYKILMKNEINDIEPQVSLSNRGQGAVEALGEILSRNQAHRGFLQKLYFEVENYIDQLEANR